MLKLNKIQGSALLTALFIMTLVAIVATAMSSRLQWDIYRTQSTIRHDRLVLASQAVSFWALHILNQQTIPFTRLDQNGRVAEFPSHLHWMDKGIQVQGNLYDLQANFNLNNLIQKEFVPLFLGLVQQVDPKLGKTEGLPLALALQDWLSPYNPAKGQDNYLAYYLAQDPPYYASHQLLQSVSEFRLVKGCSAALFQTLTPFITALPEVTPINLNTASKKVLLSLTPQNNEAQIQEFMLARKKDGIKSPKDLMELSKKWNVPSEQLTTESQYFLSIASVSTDEVQLRVDTWLKRSWNKQGKLSVRIIRQSIH